MSDTHDGQHESPHEQAVTVVAFKSEQEICSEVSLAIATSQNEYAEKPSEARGLQTDTRVKIDRVPKEERRPPARGKKWSFTGKCYAHQDVAELIKRLKDHPVITYAVVGADENADSSVTVEGYVELKTRTRERTVRQIAGERYTPELSSKTAWDHFARCLQRQRYEEIGERLFGSLDSKGNGGERSFASLDSKGKDEEKQKNEGAGSEKEGAIL